MEAPGRKRSGNGCEFVAVSVPVLFVESVVSLVEHAITLLPRSKYVFFYIIVAFYQHYAQRILLIRQENVPVGIDMPV